MNIPSVPSHLFAGIRHRIDRKRALCGPLGRCRISHTHGHRVPDDASFAAAGIPLLPKRRKSSAPSTAISTVLFIRKTIIRTFIMKKRCIRNKIFFLEVCMRGKMVVCMCAFSLFVSASGCASCGPDSTARAGDSLHQKWWAQLNLTEDQKAKLKALRGGAKDFRKTNFDKMKSLLDKSKEELLKAAPSKTVLYGYAKEIGRSSQGDFGAYG